MKKTITLLLLAIMVAMPLGATSMEDWKDQVLYFVFIDRFANGDASNDREVDPSDINGFHGGDISGPACPAEIS